ncbi:MAG: hypothetical protein ABWY08_07930 [Comamonas sp.]
MWARRLMWILWPAFLGACAMEMLVFALVDPSEIQWQGTAPGWSRQAFYTLSFFVFWLVISAAGAVTCLLGLRPAEVNGWGPEGPAQRRPRDPLRSS